MIEYLFAALLPLLAHDRAVVRDAAEVVLTEAHLTFDLRDRIAREMKRGPDAEVRRRLRRMSSLYTNAHPFFTTSLPRFRFLSSPPGQTVLHEDFTRRFHSIYPLTPGIDRGFTREFTDRLFEEGWSRWRVRLYLTEGVLSEWMER